MAKIIEVIIKIITNIIVAFLSIAIFFMLYSFISISVLNRQYVNFFGFTFYEVGSGSMADAINLNDIIIVRIRAPFEVGDVVTYTRDNEFITHRVIDIDPYTGLLTTKGDANNTPDLNVLPDSIIGKVVHILPNAAIWKKIILDPKVMLLMFVTLLLFNFTFSFNKPEPPPTDGTKKKFYFPIKITKREKRAFRN